MCKCVRVLHASVYGMCVCVSLCVCVWVSVCAHVRVCLCELVRVCVTQIKIGHYNISYVFYVYACT